MNSTKQNLAREFKPKHGYRFWFQTPNRSSLVIQPKTIAYAYRKHIASAFNKHWSSLTDTTGKKSRMNQTKNCRRSWNRQRKYRLEISQIKRYRSCSQTMRSIASEKTGPELGFPIVPAFAFPFLMISLPMGQLSNWPMEDPGSQKGKNKKKNLQNLDF